MPTSSSSPERSFRRNAPEIELLRTTRPARGLPQRNIVEQPRIIRR
jgi:hypothetical protein